MPIDKQKKNKTAKLTNLFENLNLEENNKIQMQSNI